MVSVPMPPDHMQDEHPFRSIGISLDGRYEGGIQS